MKYADQQYGVVLPRSGLPIMNVGNGQEIISAYDVLLAIATVVTLKMKLNKM